MDFLNDIGKRLSGAARSVQEKAKEGAELGRLSNEARIVNGELEKLYGALGRVYYDAQKNGAEDLSALNAFVEKIDAALRGETKGGTHLGLANIADRLRLIYGGKADIRVDGDEENRTTVSIDIPKA